MDAIRVCTVCAEGKTHEQFHKHPNGLHGLQSQCKACASAKSKKRWHGFTPEQKRDHGRRNMLKHNYGITVEQYEAIFEAQGGLCAICREPEPRRAKSTATDRMAMPVDHDHASGEVRGLLCSNCNITLGLMKDDPDRLEAAANYLRNPRPIR